MTPRPLSLLPLLAAGCWLGCGGDGPPFDVDCAAAQGAPGTASLAIDVGATAEDDQGEEGEDEDSGPAAGFLADGPYDASRGFGWLGDGEVESRAAWVVDVFPVGVHDTANPWSDPDAYHATVAPYLTWVRGLSGYRVDVPDGAYRVTLMFIEPLYPEPGLRVFDVSCNGLLLLDDLDLAARAGQDQIVEIAVQAVASDGTLELELSAVSGDAPLLAGLRVEPAVAGAGDAPAELEARAGTAEGLLRWARPADPTRGWAVARSVDGGPFEPVSAQPVPIPSLVDGPRTAGETLRYRVWPVGADCSVGPPAESAAIEVLDPADLGLPVIDVTVDPADLAAIHADPEATLEVPAAVSSGADAASGIIRLRGQSTRWLPKRSFYIKLDRGTVDGRDRLKLLAEQSPPTRLWQLAAYDLLERMGSLASRARPVLLRINGATYGVYDDIEHVGDDLLTDRGYGIDDRFRVGYDDFGLRRDDTGAVDLSGFEKKENEDEPSPELEALLVWLNTAPQHELDAQLDTYVDADVLVDYMVGQVLIANPEVVDGSHYLILDPASGAFLMAPWDLNNDTWTAASQPLALYTAYAPLWGFQSWLWTRLLDSPTYRARLVARLAEVAADEFAAQTPGRIEALDGLIAPGLAVEPFLFTRRYDAWAADGAARMIDFVSRRAAAVDESLADLADLGETGVVLVAVETGAAPAVTLENRDADAVDLAGCSLTADLAEPGAVPLEGTLEGAAAVSIATDVVAADGGYLALSCPEDGGGDDEEDDEGGGAAIRSLVFYPPLADGQIYLRDGDGWSVVDASRGRPVTRP